MASYQVVIGSLDPEENHHQTCRQQLPEEQNDPKHDVGVPADFMHVCLQHTKKSKRNTQKLTNKLQQERQKKGSVCLTAAAWLE